MCFCCSAKWTIQKEQKEYSALVVLSFFAAAAAVGTRNQFPVVKVNTRKEAP
jgi:hypothetical protein